MVSLLAGLKCDQGAAVFINEPEDALLRRAVGDHHNAAAQFVRLARSLADGIPHAAEEVAEAGGRGQPERRVP
jgi:hypothetical protein